MRIKKFYSSISETFHFGTKVLDQILDKCKYYEDKRGLSYIYKTETPTIGDTIFVKDKEKTLNQAASSNISLLCTYCKKFRHTYRSCYSRLFERYEFYLNRLMGESNFLKNQILNKKKEKQTLSLRIKKSPLTHVLEWSKSG